MMPAGVILFLVQNSSYHDLITIFQVHVTLNVILSIPHILLRYTFRSSHMIICRVSPKQNNEWDFDFSVKHGVAEVCTWCRSLSRGLGPPTPAPNIDMLLSPGCGGCGGCGGWEPELGEERSGPGHAEGENSE